VIWLGVQFAGIIAGAVTVLSIGVLHVVVVKVERALSARVWPLFAAIGLIMAACSLVIKSLFTSTIIGLLGFLILWSAYELVLQRERRRMEKGKEV